MSSGAALPGGDLRGGGEGDLQDLSGVLESSDGRALPGEPFFCLSDAPHDHYGQRPPKTAALSPCSLQGEDRISARRVLGL